jgi:hypothetical protein
MGIQHTDYSELHLSHGYAETLKMTRGTLAEDFKIEMFIERKESCEAPENM